MLSAVPRPQMRPSRTTGSKAGVVQMTKALALEWARTDINVNAICPGSVNGPRMDRVIADESASRGVSQAALRETYARQTSMRTFVQAVDIARSAVYLASDDARYVSGQVLFVDGGYTAASGQFFRWARKAPK